MSEKGKWVDEKKWYNFRMENKSDSEHHNFVATKIARLLQKKRIHHIRVWVAQITHMIYWWNCINVLFKMQTILF